MNPLVVVLVYGVSVILALALLYWLGPKAWYWHMVSVALALAVGLIPPPQAWRGAAYDLAVGFVFVFLFVWGLGAPLCDGPHHFRRRHA